MAATTIPAGLTLMSIPLELRHAIYEHAAEREKNAGVVLRHWYERQEMRQVIAESQANDPNALVPRMLYHDDVHESIQNETSEDEELDEEEYDEDEEDEEDEEPEEEWNEEEENDEQAEVEEEDVEMVEDNAEDDNTGDEGIGMTDVPFIRAHPKWRHVNKFIGITQCPPPVELLTTCKQLMREAMDWYYDVAVLRIFATASFAHTDMFEESLNQMVDAAFSPVENVRKVEIVFVWDTAWLQTCDYAPVFQAILRSRAVHVTKVLQRAPGLKQMKMIWLDSLAADKSVNEETAMLKLEILEGFYELFHNVELEEHYLEPGEEPHAKSTMGKRRLEFEAIMSACQNGSLNMF